jgi:Tfp pilus assembly protein PilF
LKDLQQSAAAAQKAIELDPELLDAYLTLGITYEDMGRQDLAFGQFRTAWQKGLNMVAIYNDWAVNFLRMKDIDRAILYLQEAIRLEPDKPASYENLATAFQMKGMLKEAEEQRKLSRQYRATQ